MSEHGDKIDGAELPELKDGKGLTYRKYVQKLDAAARAPVRATAW